MIYDCLVCGKGCDGTNELYLHVKGKSEMDDKKHKALFRRIMYIDRDRA